MSKENKNCPTMNLNAHFAWGFALWASAEESRVNGNLMLAPIGYYYSCFHSSYAYLNAIPSIEASTFHRMGHQQLSNLIAQYLGADLQADFDQMRDLREAINYLGLGEPAGKLRVLRGHSLRFGAPSNSLSLDEMVMKARDMSRTFITKMLDEVARLPKKAVDTFPRRGDATENWLQEYMQEDIYLGLMSEDMRAKTLAVVRDILS